MPRQLGLALRRGIRRFPALRRARRSIFALLVRQLLWFVRAAPRPVAESTLRGLATLAWGVLPRERWIARRQLRLAFPQAAATESDLLGRESLRVLASNLVDAVRGDRGVWFAAEDLERLAALRQGERSLLVLCAHLGAWELLGQALARRLGRFAVLTANPHNDGVARQLEAARAQRGVRSFDRRRDVLAAARWLGRGGALAILADHHSGVSNVEASWFGHPAPTVVAPARWARRFEATVLALGIRRDPAGHKVIVGRELQVGADESDSEFAGRCNAALEELIRATPVEWTWTHARFQQWPQEGTL